MWNEIFHIIQKQLFNAFSRLSRWLVDSLYLGGGLGPYLISSLGIFGSIVVDGISRQAFAHTG